MAVAAACLIGCLATSSPASAQSAAVYFDATLSPYGYWVEDPTYGRVWRPRDPGPGWRPYTYGRWVYTSEYGWVWVSEEPWGWVVYHYGHWVWTSRYGWVWIAGDVWGPAWVEWCHGNGYVGWAPMPPDPYWQAGAYNGSYECASPAYTSRAVFVSETSFTSPRVSAHVVAASQNTLVAGGTVNVTSYTRIGSGFRNSSIDLIKLQAATGQVIKPVRVVQAKGPVSPGQPSRTLQELKIYRPVITAGGLPSFDASASQSLKLDPDLPPAAIGGPSAPSLDRGGLPTLDRPPVGDISPPAVGGIGGSSLGGGGALGGVRGRLGR